MRSSGGMVGFTSGLVLLALISFAVLKSLDMPAGSFLDWLIGIATFCWLMAVVTVPWNIHFEAKEVLNEAKLSEKNKIDFDKSQLGYVRKLAFWSLFIALILHIFSAVGLYWLSAVEISVVGYYGSGAALLLTFLRPSVRAYEYISYRLASIRQDIQYPREDIQALKYELETLKSDIQYLRYTLLNAEDEESWLRKQEKLMTETRKELKTLTLGLEDFKTHNLNEHEKISKETRHAVAQLTEDGKFIDNIVEIIRFIKKV